MSELTGIEREWVTKLPGWKPNDQRGMGGNPTMAEQHGTTTDQSGPGEMASHNPAPTKSSWTGLPVGATGLTAGMTDRRSLISQYERIKEFYGTDNSAAIVEQAHRALVRARADAGQVERLKRALGY